VEFLVRIRVALPTEMSEGERERILAAELARGRELVAAGKIKAIWRIPGGLENVGIWEVEDATELHGLLESLPVYRWISVGVTALAEHPLSSG
jgi:muconolactone D-isomerase